MSWRNMTKKSFTELLVCSPKLEKTALKLVGTEKSILGFKVYPSIYCRDEYMYAFDENGVMTTIIVEGIDE